MVVKRQRDLQLFIKQLETVAAHCDDTKLRAGGATVREAIERLSRATPTPDVAGLVEEARAVANSRRDVHPTVYRALIGKLAFTVETLSRERAVLAEGFKAATGWLAYDFKRIAMSDDNDLGPLTADMLAIRKALVLIEGEKREG